MVGIVHTVYGCLPLPAYLSSFVYAASCLSSMYQLHSQVSLAHMQSETVGPRLLRSQSSLFLPQFTNSSWFKVMTISLYRHTYIYTMAGQSFNKWHGCVLVIHIELFPSPTLSLPANTTWLEPMMTRVTVRIFLQVTVQCIDTNLPAQLPGEGSDSSPITKRFGCMAWHNEQHSH